ncbi:MAG: phosphoribosylformylglycinamidine cyclo-ligase, partial [bacterium]
RKIKKLAKATFNEKVLTEIGAFGGFYKPDFTGLKSPVLVSSSDSVGTKVKLAFMTDRHDTMGQDLVNHCVNDILVHGAMPLYFMDYIATGKLKPDTIAEMVAGLSQACRQLGMPLLGGETAELPDLYQPGEYDLAGFIVGVVDEASIVNGSTIKEGDVCLGLASNGLHTNGYTLARKVAFEIAGLKPDDHVPELASTIGQALMKIHRCYLPVVRPLLDKFDIHGMAHITGGGIPGNLNRIMPDGLGAEISKSTWPVLPIFKFLQKQGNIDPADIYRTFNMGIGYILVVDPADEATITKEIEGMSEKVYRLGVVKSQTQPVTLVD